MFYTFFYGLCFSYYFVGRLYILGIVPNLHKKILYFLLTVIFYIYDII